MKLVWTEVASPSILSASTGEPRFTKNKIFVKERDNAKMQVTTQSLDLTQQPASAKGNAKALEQEVTKSVKRMFIAVVDYTEQASKRGADVV